MKPGPIAAMVLMLLLGVWLVLWPQMGARSTRTDDAARFEVIVDMRKVEVETRESAEGAREYRFLDSSALGDGWISEAEFGAALHEAAAVMRARPWILKLFNVSGWGMMIWIAIGLGGQACFFGRMFIQWVLSEKQRASVIPPLFWWLSFFGGVALFTYFVWRKDVVGVLGQSTGIVIYARNLRLIHKHNRRTRSAQQAVAPQTTGNSQPDAAAPG